MRLFRLFVLLVLMSGMVAVGCEQRPQGQPAKPEAGGQAQPGGTEGKPEVKPVEPESKEAKPAAKP